MRIVACAWLVVLFVILTNMSLTGKFIKPEDVFGPIYGNKFIKIQNEYVLEFFNKYLRDIPPLFLDGPSSKYPEVLFKLSISKNEKDFPFLKGPYLGQKPPGMAPEIFAPGIVSTEHHEFWPVFSPDGKEFYYGMSMRTGSNAVGYHVILVMQQVNNVWTKPMVASFSGKYWDMENCMSYDGKKLYFISERPKSGVGKPEDFDIWMVERTTTGWSYPHPLTTIDLGKRRIGPSVAKNGNLYFSGNYDDPDGKGDIYLSRFVNGGYQKPENLGNTINSEFHEGHVFVYPDESYMIFDSNMPGGFGKSDLYISFRKKNGSWTKAKNMGDKINSDSYEIGAFVTHDGKYLFFNSRRNKIRDYSEKTITYDEIMEQLNNPQNGNGDIYWVDAKIIEELREK